MTIEELRLSRAHPFIVKRSATNDGGRDSVEPRTLTGCAPRLRRAMARWSLAPQDCQIWPSAFQWTKSEVTRPLAVLD